MVLALTKYLTFIIGLVSVFENAIAAEELPPDPIDFNPDGLDPERDVEFFLYTSKNPDEPQQVYIGDDDGLSAAGYDLSRRTAFVTHGWKEDSNDVCVPPIRKGFLKHGYNVIVMDWGKVTKKLGYKPTAVKVLDVAKYYAKMINCVMDYGTDPSQITIVGHSLGAHVSGLAAHNSRGGISHLVALDPASPGFNNQTVEGRVDSSDADLVETIHTNTAKFGLREPIGPVDYFPNGGKFQDGCYSQPKEKQDFCAHLRACLYYAESLTKPDKWWARKCDDNDKFKAGKCSDEEVVPFARATNQYQPAGTYYLRTNNNPTFGLGEEGTRPRQ